MITAQFNSLELTQIQNSICDLTEKPFPRINTFSDISECINNIGERYDLIEIKEYISNIEKTRDSVEDVNREKFEV